MPCPARVCCRRCAAATWSARCTLGLAPADADHDAIADAARRRRRQARSARAARRRPDQRLPRRRSRAAGAGRVPPHHLDRHVPVRLDAAGRPRAGGRRVRRAGRHDHQHRGPRVSRSRQTVTAARHGAARLDDRRRAGVDARARHRLRHDRSRRRPAIAGAERRQSRAAPAGRCRRAAAQQLRLPRWSSAASSTTGAVGTSTLAVAGAAGDRRRAPTSIRSTSTGSASPTAPTSSSSGRRGSVVLPLVADEAVQRGTIWAPFNQDPGADINDLVEPARSVDRRQDRAASCMTLRSVCSAVDPMLDTDDWWWKVLAIVAAQGAGRSS